MGRSLSFLVLSSALRGLDDAIFLLFHLGYFRPKFTTFRTAPLIHVTQRNATHTQLEEKTSITFMGANIIKKT